MPWQGLDTDIPETIVEPVKNESVIYLCFAMLAQSQYVQKSARETLNGVKLSAGLQIDVLVRRNSEDAASRQFGVLFVRENAVFRCQRLMWISGFGFSCDYVMRKLHYLKCFLYMSTNFQN